MALVIGTILAIFDQQVTARLSTNCFKSINHLVLEKKQKIDLWQPSWISDPNYLSYFWSTSHSDFFLSSFKSIAVLVQEKKQKIDFQDGRHGSYEYLGFLIRMILAIFDLQVTLSFLPSLKTSSLWIQEEKWKIDFQGGHHGGYLGIRSEWF